MSKKSERADADDEEKEEGRVVAPPLVNEKTMTLLYSVCSSDYATVDRLVAHYNYEDSILMKDVNGSSALHLAVKRGDESMVAKLLCFPHLRSIVNLTEKPIIGGYAAIHLACAGGFETLATLLIQAGSLLNIKSDSNLGETPLHCALKNNKKKCAKVLIEAGCKVDARDNFGHNASFWANRLGNNDLIAELGLPPPKCASPDEFMALLLQKNKNFVLPTAKVKKVSTAKKGK